jgi:acyl-CoA hydrolase
MIGKLKNPEAIIQGTALMKPKEKTPTESMSYIAEIVGEESLLGQRMVAGKLLHMMDFAAANAAAQHAESPLVTLAFDRIELLDYICHRDYVRYDACVIKVGSSSIVVKVDGYTKAPTEMVIRKGHSGFITMVAIDDHGKPNKNIPALAYKSEEDFEKKKIAENRECLLKERKREIDQIDLLKQVDDALLKDYFSRTASFPPPKTGLTIRKAFLPRNANAIGIVFGGDTIELMEELALATARQFTGNIKMVTIAMEDVVFLKPLYVEDLVEMTSHVVFVANTTLVVEIAVKAVSFVGTVRDEMTNKGTFTVLNYDQADEKKSILNGLDLSNEDVAIKKCYLKEQGKYENRTGIRSTFRDVCE